MEEVSIPALWTENNQMELNALYKVPIEIANTLYERFLAQQKRDAERAYQKKMSAEEKLTSRRRWRRSTRQV